VLDAVGQKDARRITAFQVGSADDLPGMRKATGHPSHERNFDRMGIIAFIILGLLAVSSPRQSCPGMTRAASS
jgi:hypothetical protein